MLARACENEAENAKRMRMGMEPVSQSLPSQVTTSQVKWDMDLSSSLMISQHFQ